MKLSSSCAVIACAVTVSALGALTARSGWAQQAAQRPGSQIETRIWLDRGVDPVFERGDQARVYYRASVDAYLLVFHIDTDGVLRLLFPGGIEEANRARGGRDYRLLFPDSDTWLVDEAPGVGYFFALASGTPFSFDRLSEVPVAGGWDSSPGRNRIRADPYAVVEDFRRVLLPQGEPSEYAIDFTAYHVGQPYSYPRFLCYQCHVEAPFEQWNPYHQTCLDVRVVIYNDPYYYPAMRYRGDQVLYARPPEPGLPQFAFTRRFLGEAGTPIVQSRTATRSTGPDPFPAVGGRGAEILRSVNQRGFLGPSGGSPLPTPPADQAPWTTPLPSTSGPPGSLLPVVPRQGSSGARPTLRRRGGDRAPTSR